MHIPDLAKWNMTPENLLQKATSAPHPRTRERFAAVLAMAMWSNGATDYNRHKPDRNVRTHMDWARKFNRAGPESLVYKRSGGRKASPLLTP